MKYASTASLLPSIPWLRLAKDTTKKKQQDMDVSLSFSFSFSFFSKRGRKEVRRPLLPVFMMRCSSTIYDVCRSVKLLLLSAGD